MKQRTHRLTLTVTFDKPCTRDVARREAADNIHGEFFASGIAQQYEADTLRPLPYPGKFRVRSIKGERR